MKTQEHRGNAGETLTLTVNVGLEVLLRVTPNVTTCKEGGRGALSVSAASLHPLLASAHALSTKMRWLRACE